ncbi:mitochondrial transcription rescue factor 1 [Gadus chalcogrammus]|uniref:mitochondrial transcription rescue factor 1 n=1 Tax=Gadus chalcogrammus TaxID=1042646 RepID=UPI0024C274EE|nr:mitochondrial transcription rescue factor 1 [Gadus chalcogrammus]XP_056446519.1 mitochondrial transcription rescue factor 1 [Gadus chalcogrammus]
MQGLLVEALALRQLGRLNPRQLLTPGYGFKQTTWCPRIMYTRQLWGSSVCFTLGSHRPVVRGRDSVRNWSLHQLRFKSNKKKGLAKVLEEEEEEEEEEERDTEDTDSEDEIEEDPNLPKDYKDLEKFVQSYRYDVILKSGLDMARNKIEDAFYNNKLRLNGQKLIKKSKSVKVGDTLDMVVSESGEGNTVTLMRVILKKELGESNDGEKYKVALRRWKSLELSKDEAFKP